MNKCIARNLAIKEMLKRYPKPQEKSNKPLTYDLLEDGLVPEELQAEFKVLNDKFLIETEGQVDSDLDKCTHSAYLYTENKIIGREIPGSGFLNPVLLRGKLEDIDNFITDKVQNFEVMKAKKTLVEPTTSNQKPTTEIEEAPTTKIKVEQLNSTELTVLNKIQEYKNDAEPIKEGLLTIEETLKIYSPQVTEAEIKGFVYYKQKYGSPMIGWEKYFLPQKGARGKLVFAKQGCTLLNQQWQSVKLVPSETMIGQKTKFKKEYKGEQYCIIKTDTKELFIVKENDIYEKDNFATVDEAELMKLVKEKGLCFDGADYLPVFIFTFGDIYKLYKKWNGSYNAENDEMVDSLKEIIENKFGKEVAKWHEELLMSAFKSKLKYDFSNPVKSERPFMSYENELAHKIYISELDITSGASIKKYYDRLDNLTRNYNKRVFYGTENNKNKVTLFEAYEIWFGEVVTEENLKDISKIDIINYYFNSKRVVFTEKESESIQKELKIIKEKLIKEGKPTDYETMQKLEDNLIKEKKTLKQAAAKIEGDRMFNEFLSSSLDKNDLYRLNLEFNEAFSNFVSYDLAKVPVAFEVNRNILNIPNFKLKPVQRDGLAFMSITGSGCLAYDVGFGKTLTAIHNMAMLLKQGTIKRPLIAVPKQVYKNWLYEMFGYWTDGSERDTEEFKNSKFVPGTLSGTKYKLNDWTNLNEQVVTKNNIQNKEIPEYTITIVSYQGLEKIGFSERIFDELGEELNTILKSDVYSEKYSDEEKAKKTEREREKAKQKSDSDLGKALAKTVFDVDALNFDYLIMDEAHAFKNIFTSFALPPGFGNEWKIKGGKSSSRGLKGFTLAMYMQLKYNGNVNLLTATPFTNSPMELYSMLSLVGYNYLAQSNINSVFKFMSMFIETSQEYIVNYENNIKIDSVVKSFKNRTILRDILCRYFDYQDNPVKADVQRPCKLNFPNKKTSTSLKMSELQLVAKDIISEEAASVSKENPGAIGRALNWAKSNAFSPYLVKELEPLLLDHDLEQIIDNSPKLRYTIDCIKTVKEYHESLGQECSGQVIYSNRGRSMFNLFKQALEEECGFKKKIRFGATYVDEVSIITSDGNEDEKELIKDGFNAGFIKVIIGTATIQEGINLQKRSTVLYNLDLDWNPTSFKQLEGRIHRQGNAFQYVRIVVPMVQNTLDSFINQKLDEKSKRIASIWDFKTNTNEANVNDSVDPIELKFQLITDSMQLTNMKLDFIRKDAEKDYLVASNKYEVFSRIKPKYDNYIEAKTKVLSQAEETYSNVKTYQSLIERRINEFNSEDDKKASKKEYDRLMKSLTEVAEMYEEFKATNVESNLFSFASSFRLRNFVFKVEVGDFYLRFEFGELKKKYGLSNYSYEIINQFDLRDIDSYKGYFVELIKIEKAVLRPYNLTFHDDLSGIQEPLYQEMIKTKSFYERTQEEDFIEDIRREVVQELADREALTGEVEDRVQAFAEYNHLLTYPFKERPRTEEETEETCEFPDSPLVEGDVPKYLKVALKKDEFIEETDVNVKVAKKKFVKIQDFMAKPQVAIVKEELEAFADVIDELYTKIRNTPKIYETESIALEDKIAHLHYFNSSSDYFVIEMEQGDIFDNDTKIQKQSFVWSILNRDTQNAELGYLSIEELKEYCELDFHFEPTKMSEILERYEEKVAEKSENPFVKSYKKLIEEVKLMIEITDNEEVIESYYKLIEEIKMMIELEN
jgi:superfamily II DNA or RNA helicase